MRPDTSTACARIERVSVDLGGRRILDDISIDVLPGRTAVIGANGSGKSTFGRLLNGLMAPSTGTVTVCGLDSVRQCTELRRRVGFVFTNPDAQILMPTPAEDLALSLRGMPKVEVARRVVEVLAEQGLTAQADIPASALSGGQKQLLALASVLITRPALLVADEPTTLLDLRNARRIGDLLLAQDVPTVIVTHDLDLAARCDRVILIEDGRIADAGEPDPIIAAYRRAAA